MTAVTSCRKLYQARNRFDKRTTIPAQLISPDRWEQFPFSPLFLLPGNLSTGFIMASTSSETKEHAKRQTSLRRLINECNIHFHSIDEPLPSSLQREYNAVQAIEESTYATNLLHSSNVTNERKNDILEAVRSCLDSEDTEQDWRQEVEAKILYPLTKHHIW